MGLALRPDGAWRVVSASVAGTSHIEADAPCADASAVRVLRTAEAHSLLVAVASDGAGTSARAAEGAALAVSTTLDAANAWAIEHADLSDFTEETGRAWVGAVRDVLATRASDEGLVPRDFACTLLVALVDDTRAVFVQVGDGVIVCGTEAGGYVPVTWPQNGEYANMTWFSTDPDSPAVAEVRIVTGIDEIALLTDGLQALALRYATRDAHDPFFEPMFQRLRRELEPQPAQLAESLRGFLGSAAVNARTDDDKTLVLATRLGPCEEST
jgi:hypothetical protein